MAIAGLAPEVMRPTALALNILVAAITVYRFPRALLFVGRAVAIPARLRAASGVWWRIARSGGYLLSNGRHGMLASSVSLLVWRVYGTGFRRDDQGFVGQSGSRGAAGRADRIAVGTYRDWRRHIPEPHHVAGRLGGTKNRGRHRCTFHTSQLRRRDRGRVRHGLGKLPGRIAVVRGRNGCRRVCGHVAGLRKLSQRGLITALAAVMLVAAAKLIAIA